MNNQIKYVIKKIKLYYFSFKYSKYYPVAVPAVLITISILIFFTFVFPQIQSWFSVRDEVEITRGRIDAIHKNILFLGNTNQSSVDTDFQHAVQALPSEKGFLGILRGISKSAALSSISLHDYNFSLGTVNTGKKNVPSALTPITITLDFEGTVSSVSSFVSELETKLPLVTLKALDFSNGKGEIILFFYVKPFPVLSTKDSDPVNIIAKNDQELLQRLAEWSD